MIQKYREEKEVIKVNKQKEEKSFILQKYLRGYYSRMTLRKQLVAEMSKNLSDLDKLSTLVYEKKGGQIFYLPMKNLFTLMRQFTVILKLKVYPKRLLKKKEPEHLDLLIGLSKWV